MELKYRIEKCGEKNSIQLVIMHLIFTHSIKKSEFYHEIWQSSAKKRGSGNLTSANYAKIPNTYLSAEKDVISQIDHTVLKQEDKALVESIIFTLHIYVLDSQAQHMFVERACEVAVKQLVVIDCLGDDAPNKFEVAKVVTVAVGGWVDAVSDTVPRRRQEEGIVLIKNLM